MRADSVVGRGTTVTFTLPLRAEEQLSDEEKEKSQIVG